MMTLLRDLLGFGQRPLQHAGGALGLFLSGASIPAAAAATYGGGDMLTTGQRWTESEIRGYIGELEREIEDLRAQLDDALAHSS